MNEKKLLFTISLIGLLGAVWPFSWMISHPNHETPGTQAWMSKEEGIIESLATDIDPKVVRLSLEAYQEARREGHDNKQLLTIIDYSKPSTSRRLWVFDLKNGRKLFDTWVSHGKNSGENYAHSFSNKEGSLKSSFGVFVTDKPYIGGHGLSLRIRGLEKGINDNAYRRDIVFHGAKYVNAYVASHASRIGRSWGCPAVDQHTIKSLVKTIKDDTLVFAYYPDHHWLKTSKFLRS